MKNPLLEVTDLAYGVPGGRTLVSGLSFHLDPGELLLLTGPNGSGKSTLLGVILGELMASRGILRNRVPRSRTAVIPQLQNIEFHLPVTLRDVLEVSHKTFLSTEEIESVGLLQRHQLDLLWNTASGGERQRTLMTRALLQEPRLLILDEPFNHLDDGSQARILEALGRFLGDGDEKGALLVSHVAVTELERTMKVKHVRLPKRGEG